MNVCTYRCVCVCSFVGTYKNSWIFWIWWPIPENEHYFISAVFFFHILWYPHPHRLIFALYPFLLSDLHYYPNWVSHTHRYIEWACMYCICIHCTCVCDRGRRYGENCPVRYIHIQKLLKLVQPILLLLLLALAVYVVAYRYFLPIIYFVFEFVLFLAVLYMVVWFELV